MNELIDHIRAAIAQGATPEQKAIGAQACRTILAALDAQPGKPIVLPGATPAQSTSRLTFDQALDLVIARLRTVADEHDKQIETATAVPSRNLPAGMRIPLMQPATPSISRPVTSKRKP
jgi:hypothetical protein